MTTREQPIHITSIYDRVLWIVLYPLPPHLTGVIGIVAACVGLRGNGPGGNLAGALAGGKLRRAQRAGRIATPQKPFGPHGERKAVGVVLIENGSGSAQRLGPAPFAARDGGIGAGAVSGIQPIEKAACDGDATAFDEIFGHGKPRRACSRRRDRIETAVAGSGGTIFGP